MLKPLLQKILYRQIYKGTSRQYNTTTGNIKQVTLEKVKMIIKQLNWYSGKSKISKSGIATMRT